MCVLGIPCKWCFFSNLLLEWAKKTTNTTEKIKKSDLRGQNQKKSATCVVKYTALPTNGNTNEQTTTN